MQTESQQVGHKTSRFVLLISTLLIALMGLASDEKALLAGIRAQPDEDTPRLAYADWLMENGETESRRAYGQFIKMQVELAAKSDIFASSRLNDFQQTAQKIANLHEKYKMDWTPELLQQQKATLVYDAVGPNESMGAVIWRRGFIEGVSVVPAGARSRQYWSMLEQLPALDFLTLGGPPTFDTKKIPTRLLSRIRGVSIPSDFDDEQTDSVLDRINNLQRLGLNVHGPSNSRVGHVLSTRHAANLRTLSIIYSNATTLTPLWRSQSAVRLETLSLHSTSLNANIDSLPGLESPKTLPALRNLRLAYLHSEEMRVFIRHPRFHDLEQVEIRSSNGLTSEMLLEIAKNGEKLLSFNDSNRDASELPTTLNTRLIQNREKVCGLVLKAFLEVER